jgi:hypothetical protein
MNKINGFKNFPTSQQFDRTSDYLGIIRKSTNREINDSIATIKPNKDFRLKRKMIRPKSSYTRLQRRPDSAVTKIMKKGTSKVNLQFSVEQTQKFANHSTGSLDLTNSIIENAHTLTTKAQRLPNVITETKDWNKYRIFSKFSIIACLSLKKFHLELL